jgi:sugar phosphate isomerase/epimerase
MRLGGPITEKYNFPEEWIQILKKKNYKAAFCPLNVKDKPAEVLVQVYTEAVKKNNILIAEVGIWNNPLSKDEKTKKEAIEICKAGLVIAEKMEARCCVNISGSRGDKWDGPCSEDLTGDTFDMIVETVQEIIDAVKPKKTFYTLEAMPWMYPDSIDSYLELIDSIGRERFGVHMDITNMINCPEKYFNNGQLITEFVEKLGPYIKSCHIKDVTMKNNMTVHLDETAPGEGNLDFRTLLRELNKLDKDLPIMMEHLKNEKEYDEAANFIRSIAKKENITV